MKRVLIFVLTLAILFSVSGVNASGAGYNSAGTTSISLDDNNFVELSNVTQEEYIKVYRGPDTGIFALYTANAPVTVNFNGEEFDKQQILSTTYEKLVDADFSGSEVKFDVKRYKIFNEKGSLVLVDNLPEGYADEYTYAAGNYATLRESGYYYISATSLSGWVQPFFIYITGDTYVYNQSTLTLMDWHQMDSGHVVAYKMENKLKLEANEHIIDTSRYALVLYFPETWGTGLFAEIHFLDSRALNAGESFYSEFNTQFAGEYVVNGLLKSILVKFDSDEEMRDFRLEVPTIHTNDAGVNEQYLIDSGNKGIKWFTDTFHVKLS